MQRVQVFLHEDQYAALKKIAHFSGIAQSDLIRQGVDLIIKNRASHQQSWKQAAYQIAGIWRDHDELETSQQLLRHQLRQRLGIKDE
ncbi:ribbon-helix-helix domain-containing protein [Thiothrix eikelboomii]|uniref:ribbon-helix-helix domain-containing protein n=1 Tax=Thiothrix eikelboomii TaxID=92487 RepID=UPI003BAFE1F2